MTPDTDDQLSVEEQWAYIFNTFGEEPLRNILFSSATDLTRGETPAEQKIIEFTDETALDITDHHNALENQRNTNQ